MSTRICRGYEPFDLKNDLFSEWGYDSGHIDERAGDYEYDEADGRLRIKDFYKKSMLRRFPR